MTRFRSTQRRQAENKAIVLFLLTMKLVNPSWQSQLILFGHYLVTKTNTVNIFSRKLFHIKVCALNLIFAACHFHQLAELIHQACFCACIDEFPRKTNLRNRALAMLVQVANAFRNYVMIHSVRSSRLSRFWAFRTAQLRDCGSEVDTDVNHGDIYSRWCDSDICYNLVKSQKKVA